MVSVTASVMATMALMVLWISTCATLSSVLLREIGLRWRFTRLS